MAYKASFHNDIFHSSNHFFHIFIRHTWKHRQRDDLFIGRFGYRAEASTGMKFLPVKRGHFRDVLQFISFSFLLFFKSSWTGFTGFYRIFLFIILTLSCLQLGELTPRREETVKAKSTCGGKKLRLCPQVT